jgi:F0F1-type ATP synthase membrane subunit b/b'
MLDTRREKILGSLRSADDRFKQAQLELDTAKAELASANDKVQEIKNDGRKTLEALTSEQGSRLAEVTTRFAGLKDETIRLEEEKAIAQFRRQLVNVAFEKAISGIQSQMNASLHRKYIDAKISLMTSSL